MKCINREAPSLIWTHDKYNQVHSKEDKCKFVGRKNKKLYKLLYLFVFISLFEIALSEESMMEKLLGFSQERVFLG